MSLELVNSSMLSICEVKYPGTGAKPPVSSLRIPSVPPVLMTSTKGFYEEGGKGRGNGEQEGGVHGGGGSDSMHVSCQIAHGIYCRR